LDREAQGRFASAADFKPYFAADPVGGEVRQADLASKFLASLEAAKVAGRAEQQCGVGEPRAGLFRRKQPPPEIVLEAARAQRNIAQVVHHEPGVRAALAEDLHLPLAASQMPGAVVFEKARKRLRAEAALDA